MVQGPQTEASSWIALPALTMTVNRTGQDRIGQDGMGEEMSGGEHGRANRTSIHPLWVENVKALSLGMAKGLRCDSASSSHLATNSFQLQLGPPCFVLGFTSERAHASYLYSTLQQPL